MLEAINIQSTDRGIHKHTHTHTHTGTHNILYFLYTFKLIN